jgi:hypothetical protein
MKEHAYSCRLVKSCAVAQALLETVSVKSRAEKHKKAIGKLLCCASIDYDPGATIPPEITCLLVEMGIQNTPPWTLKTESAAPGKIEYAFSSSHNVFAVDRDFEYSFVEKHKNQTAWHVHTTLEIDENDQDKIDVTFKSNGGSQ